MIGNDIVDLALARKESNWKRKGFLDKIFTKNEQLLISSADSPTTMVWNLWTRKEATYKIYNRQMQIRGFFPLQIECFDTETVANFTFGQAHVHGQVYFTKTELHSEFIHTIAVENKQYFDTIITLNSRNNIEKQIGIPSYLAKENAVMSPVSISHHGRFERIIRI